MTCSIFVEFAGIWFAKKAFGPTWNIVQVKIHEEENTPEPNRTRKLKHTQTNVCLKIEIRNKKKYLVYIKEMKFTRILAKTN